ncbi:MAG: hypothetical protein MPN21_12240 [Thermoanaerobaculia bacterium]|nr:hypothetical protein [Thermoanaerobaculia bacterium]
MISDVSTKQYRRNRSAPLTALLALGLSIVTGTVVPAVAQSAGAVEIPLTFAEVRLEFYDATLHVLLDASALPFVRAFAEQPGEQRRPAAILISGGSNGIPTIRTTAPDRPGEDGARHIEVTIGAEQLVTVYGSGLQITAHEIETPHVTAPRGVHYDIEGSQLSSHGGRDTRVEARRSTVWMENSRGQLYLSVADSAAELAGHEGEAEIVAATTEFTLTASGRKLDVNLDGGSLFLGGGEGELNLEAREAVVVVERWPGVLNVAGADSTLEIRQSHTAVRTQWSLGGSRQNISLDEVTAQVTANLDGGRLDGRNLAGVVQVEARDLAVVELSDLANKATLSLSGNSEATVSRAQGVDLTVGDSSVRIEDVHSLSVQGTGADFYGSGVGRLGSFELTASQIELDLSATSHPASIRLTGPTDARLDMTSPCMVRVTAATDAPSDPVNVTGCELSMPGQPVGRMRAHIVTLELHGDVQVNATGRP